MKIIVSFSHNLDFCFHFCLALSTAILQMKVMSTEFLIDGKTYWINNQSNQSYKPKNIIWDPHVLIYKYELISALEWCKKWVSYLVLSWSNLLSLSKLIQKKNEDMMIKWSSESWHAVYFLLIRSSMGTLTAPPRYRTCCAHPS